MSEMEIVTSTSDDKNRIKINAHTALDDLHNMEKHRNKIRLAIRKLERKSVTSERSTQYKNLVLDALPMLLQVRKRLIALRDLARAPPTSEAVESGPELPEPDSTTVADKN